MVNFSIIVKGIFKKYIYFFTADIYERVSASCEGLGLATECLGGGRIEHNPSAKLIKVYGYSQVQMTLSIIIIILFKFYKIFDRVSVKLIIQKQKKFY